MPPPNKLQVFQDFHLNVTPEQRTALRQAIMSALSEPWSHTLEAEQTMTKFSGTDDDVMVFQKKESKDSPAANLFLWSTADGYKITNIVPTDTNSLDYADYNAIVQNFATKIAIPVAQRIGFKYELSAPFISIDDLVSNNTVKSLRLFSNAANKSTGSTHPRDRGRWVEFLISAFHDEKKLNASDLSRWLHECDGWPEDEAHELASQFELGIEILEAYEQKK